MWSSAGWTWRDMSARRVDEPDIAIDPEIVAILNNPLSAARGSTSLLERISEACLESRSVAVSVQAGRAIASACSFESSILCVAFACSCAFFTTSSSLSPSITEPHGH